MVVDIDDDSYIDRLKDVRKEEQTLVARLMDERLYLAEVFRIDPLTGLYNRKILPKVREVGTVIMCDIDDFKTVNDTFGHAVGDDALRSVGHAILENIRVGDIGCRFGGDEFLIIFTTDNHDVIDARMRKIARDAQAGVNVPGLNLTLSVGVAFNGGEKQIALADDKEAIIQGLIENADKALYESKDNGKNQISYYEPRKVYEYRRPESRNISFKGNN